MKEPSREVGIYGPAQLRQILKASCSDFLPYLVIASFAGLRQSELQRLRWEDIGEKYIRIRGAEKRTKSTRLVEIQPNLIACINSFKSHSGLVVTVSNVANALGRISKRSGVQQVHNTLRHSYGSYRLAIIQDAAQVSFEMGNSPQMVFKHYR